MRSLTATSSSGFIRPSLEGGILGPEHLKDDCETLMWVKGEYDPRTGEYGEDQESVFWSGKGSIQPYVRPAMSQIQAPNAGIALAVDGYKIYLPFDAVPGRSKTWVVRSNGVYYEPSSKPLNVGGQSDYWLILAAEVNR